MRSGERTCATLALFGAACTNTRLAAAAASLAPGTLVVHT